MIILLVLPLVFLVVSQILANRNQDRLTEILRRESVNICKGGSRVNYDKFNVVRYQVRQGGLVYSI